MFCIFLKHKIMEVLWDQLFRVYLGFHFLFFFGSYHSFNKILLSRLTWGFMSDLGFRVYDEGFAWV